MGGRGTACTRKARVGDDFIAKCELSPSNLDLTMSKTDFKMSKNPGQGTLDGHPLRLLE